MKSMTGKLLHSLLMHFYNENRKKEKIHRTQAGPKFMQKKFIKLLSWKAKQPVYEEKIQI